MPLSDSNLDLISHYLAIIARNGFQGHLRSMIFI